MPDDLTTLTLTQRVPAPPEQVYDAWTDPERLAAWWWPPRLESTYEMDVRVGGRYRVRSEVAGFGVHGTFVELARPERLELTWVWEEGGTDGPTERVVVDLAPDGGGTLVTLAHTTQAAGAPDLLQGWTDCLGRLGELTGWR